MQPCQAKQIKGDASFHAGLLCSLTAAARKLIRNYFDIVVALANWLNLVQVVELVSLRERGHVIG